MPVATIITFIFASLALTITPGPSILLGVVHAVRHGAGKTVYTVLGDISANFLQMLLVGVGLGAVIAGSESAFAVIKWFGVITLVSMGLGMMRRKSGVSAEVVEEVAISRWKLYRSGFLVAAGNPKALVFFTAFFPQFIDPDRLLWPQMAILCPIMTFLDFTFVMTYAASAQRFLRFLRKHPRLLSRAGGTILCGGALYLALSRHEKS